jgi:ankyrin repeat protein
MGLISTMLWQRRKMPSLLASRSSRQMLIAAVVLCLGSIGTTYYVWLRGMSYDYALGHGYLSVVQRYIDHDPKLLNDDKSGVYPLPPIFYAADNGQFAVVKYLAARGARQICAHEDLIHWTALWGHLAAVRYLLSAGHPSDIFVDAAIGDNAAIGELCKR